nr:hypothetical protein [Tanacetum cinerariifolium]
PRVTSPTAEEGSMQQLINELTALCTSLQRQHSELFVKFQAQEVEINRLKERVKILEDKEGVIGDRSGDDTPIKGRRIDEEEVATKRVSSDTEEVRLDEGEVAAERASEDTKEIETVLTTMDAAIVLSSGTAEVPTGSESIPTASPPAAEVPSGSDVVPTASPVFATATVVTLYRRRKGKEVMVESETPKKQKLEEQIDAQISRELKEQLEREDQRRSNEVISKHLTEYDQAAADLTIEERIELINELKRDFYMAVIRNNLGWKAKDFKGEAGWLKRKGIRSEGESAKKQKISKEVPEEVKSSDEVPEEKIKEMMQLVLIEEVYMEALQVKHPIIDWEVHTEGQRAYWKITRLGAEWKLYDKCEVHQLTSKDKDIFMLVEKDYPLRKGLALMMICYKLQVENYSQMADDLVQKI